jgi:hypothetical protein
MDAAVMIRLSKPRISALILEGTGAVLALVLAVWLLLWFLAHKAQSLPLDAFYVAGETTRPEDVPFQAADVILLSGREKAAAKKGESKDTLIGSIKECLNRGNTAFIYLSAPVLATGKNPKSAGVNWVSDVIREVCLSKARATDVVLALDLAQIDTDRELGVYGNSPYRELQKTLEQIDNNRSAGHLPERNVYVLTSAAPDQKSWVSEELGHSIFAYVLDRELPREGSRAIGRTQSGLTVDELYGKVRDGVRGWVAQHRNNSVQTPELRKIFQVKDAKDRRQPDLAKIRQRGPVTAPKLESGDDVTPGSITDPIASAVKPPGDAARAKSEPAPTPDTSPPSVSQSDDSLANVPIALRGDFDTLIASWKDHDDLASKKLYRYCPGAWRSYQDSLLRAERRLRVACANPGDADARADSRFAVDLLTEARKRLLDREAEFLKREEQLRFHSWQLQAKANPDVKKQIDQALRFLTDRAPQAPSVTAPGVAAPAVTAPGGLEDITPKRFLELQLPAWAYRFAIEFHRPDYFNPNERGKLLRSIVDSRAKAEEALALDRRGTDLIADTLERGDAARRVVQDQLLSGLRPNVLESRCKDQLETMDKCYGDARDQADQFQQSRATWERAAVELPSLVEWAIRSESYQKPSQDSVLDRAQSGLDCFATLSNKIFDGDDKTDSKLQKASADMKDALDGLSAAFRERLNLLRESPKWIGLDAALRTSLIPAVTRKALLLKLFDLKKSATPTSTPTAEGGSEDPGFGRRAAGCASLDRALLRIAAGDHKAAGLETLAVAMNSLDPNQYRADWAEAYQKSLKAAEATFSEITSNSKLPKKEEIGPALPLADRRARLVPLWMVQQTGATKYDDAAVMRYWEFAWFAASVFQRDRLREDFAEADALRNMDERLEDYASNVPVLYAPEKLEFDGNPLQVILEPKETLEFKRWKARLSIGYKLQERIPRGQAFVGLVVPNGLEVHGEMSIPGELVAVEKAGSAKATEYDLTQVGLDDTKGSLSLSGVVFYRGRVDQKSIDVRPDNSSDRVTVEIRRDEVAWQERYDGANIRQYDDQFENHPDHAYLHLGKAIDFKLTITNRFHQPLRVKSVIQLVDPANPKPANPAKAETITVLLEPGQSQVIKRGKVQSDRADPKAERKLTVSLKAVDEKDAELKLRIQEKDFEVTFSNLTLEDYMDITTNKLVNFACADHKAESRHCYVLTYRRLETDRFTDPVDCGEWRCKVNEEDAKAKPKDGSRWLRPGAATSFHYFLGSADFGSYKWFGWIENEDEIGGTGFDEWKRVDRKNAPQPNKPG